MNNYRQLPFATYDLAIYLPGGAVILWLLIQAEQLFLGQAGGVQGPAGSDQGSAVIFGSLGQSSAASFVELIIWLAASYLAGHIGAFVSTYVIERPLHNFLGYPSNIWLEKEEKFSKNKKYSVTKIFRQRISNGTWHLSSKLAFAISFPLWIHIAFFRWATPVGFYDSKLPSGLLPKVEAKFATLRTGIRVQNNTRWEKVVEHFVANNCSSAYARMYNYLVIYGALRLTSLILLLCSWISLAESIRNAANFGIILDFERFVIFAVFSTASFLSIIAFAKFNRRYFEESILAFLFGQTGPPI